jgi:hypothetical protein
MATSYPSHAFRSRGANAIAGFWELRDAACLKMDKDLQRKQWPGAAATLDAGSEANPERASQYLRFALSQLADKDGHHTFEWLCFQLARKRL